MSGCLHFLNNLKYIKDLMQDYITSCKIFFTIKSNSFQRKHELMTTPFSFQSSLLFVIEAILISEKNYRVHRFGALLEISDTFSSKLDVFSHMILQCLLI